MQLVSLVTFVLTLASLPLPSYATSGSDSSSSDLAQQLSHTEWLLAKTHRMVVRAKKFGRTEKRKVFEKREHKYKSEVEHLERQLFRTRTRPSSTTVAKTTSLGSKSSTVSPVLIKSSTAVATPKPTFSASSRSSQRKGLGFEHLVDLKPFAPSTTSNVTWAYNWNSHLFEPASDSPKMPNGVQFVPMLWKPDPEHVGPWIKDVDSWRNQPGKLTHVLGFNEPDLPGQADINITTCIQGWKDHMEPLAHGSQPLKLVSPAVTNGGAPMGLTYLANFMAGVKAQQLTVDAIALHWYDSPTNTAYFKNYLTDAHNQFGLPIWLTEYGFNSGTDQQKEAFHAEMVPWMNAQPWIERYAAFGDFVNTFVTDQGSLLPLGASYASA
ncbi:glycoside hydrolase family protein [Sporobolomyces koalae]|uniref:glycoside hydrolase family protein n=1 Tax=Sporobolomyces koalae TaxID=500713 RepID=UPI0031716870